MRTNLRSKLTFANVTSALALWVALSTGVAYAANTVFSTDIVDGEVKTADLHNRAVTTEKLANDSVKTSKVINNSLLSADLKTGTVRGVKILDGTVTQTDIATDGVGAQEVQDNSIDAGEIVDFTLTNQDVNVFSAEVNAGGTIASASMPGVTSGRVGATGSYEVDFGRNVANCVAVATVGPAGGGSALGEVNVADRASNAEAVFVDTNNSNGSSADKPFRLVVVC